MQESILDLIDRLIASPGQVPVLDELESRSRTASAEDKDLLRRYIEFERHLPSTFMLETVLACNLHCPECAIGGGMTTRKRKLLSYEEFGTVFSKVKHWARYTYLHLWGEPFMNKEILAMTRVASATSKVNLSTNALLIKKSQVPEIIGSGVGDLIVSIDGVSQEVYQSYRVGGCAEDAFQALEWLAQENRNQGNRVCIMPQFIVFSHNKHEMSAFRDRCGAMGLSACFKAPYLRGQNSRFRASSLVEYQRQTWADLPSLRQAISQCNDPPNVMTVDVHGNVIVCCHDYNGEMSFGNLLESSFEDVWNSPKYRMFRWNTQTGRTAKFCETKCMSYFLSSEYPIET